MRKIISLSNGSHDGVPMKRACLSVSLIHLAAFCLVIANGAGTVHCLSEITANCTSLRKNRVR